MYLQFSGQGSSFSQISSQEFDKDVDQADDHHVFVVASTTQDHQIFDQLPVDHDDHSDNQRTSHRSLASEFKVSVDDPHRDWIVA